MKVLVVDDDARVARALSLALTRLGLEITLAESGQTALQCLRGRRFDVVVIDLRMPGMDGLDLLRHASNEPDFPPAILHSAYIDVPTTVLAMRAGATEVLLKPVEPIRLAERIQALSTHRPTDAEASRVIPRPEALANAPLLLGTSAEVLELRQAIRRVAKFRDLAVLIEGPTGTGKELVAQSIHHFSAPGEPLVSVNCAAIPAELFESELFGHESGAFTGARGARAGLLEEARAGTLFLDEVGELPHGLQAKLLRVLESREFRRVGSNRVRRFNARVVSATNRWLAQDSAHFRSDLYFRISGHTLRTPALRDHASDIPLLAEHFCRQFCERNGVATVAISEGAINALRSFDWPGNVRQLRAVIEKAVVEAEGPAIEQQQIERALDHAPGSLAETRRKLADRSPSRPLPDMARELMLEAYRSSGQNLSRAAEMLGIPRTTLRDRLKRYGVR